MNTPALSQSPGFPAAVHTAPPEVSVYEAARIMHWRKVGVVVVVQHHRPVGIVTDVESPVGHQPEPPRGSVDSLCTIA